jgi:hypothetical protein
MNSKLMQKRVIESLAMLTIGDGVLALVQPRRHVALWRSGPRFWRKSLVPFVRRPQLTRLLGLSAVGLGIWCASRQWSNVRG